MVKITTNCVPTTNYFIVNILGIRKLRSLW